MHCGVSPTCRLCSADLETDEDIVAGCSALALTDYTAPHNQVLRFQLLRTRLTPFHVYIAIAIDVKERRQDAFTLEYRPSASSRREHF